jgi:hypothetical protein
MELLFCIHCRESAFDPNVSVWTLNGITYSVLCPRCKRVSDYPKKAIEEQLEYLETLNPLVVV